FLPVNGGADGSIVLRKILTQEFETGTYLCILWSSLSNPKKIIGIIERSYKVLFIQCLSSRFGPYTSSPDILTYLQSMRQKNVSVFDTDNFGNNFYRLIGTILVRNS